MGSLHFKVKKKNFMQLKKELDTKMNRERMKDIRISEIEKSSIFYFIFSSLELDHNLWQFAVLFIKPIFQIVFFYVDLIIFTMFVRIIKIQMEDCYVWKVVLLNVCGMRSRSWVLNDYFVWLVSGEWFAVYIFVVCK